MPPSLAIRLLTAEDADAAVRLRRMALSTDGYAFGERRETDPSLDVDFVQRRLADGGIEAGAVVVGAFDPDLIGVIGLHRISPELHGARLWGFYVQPDRRRRGVGRLLLDQSLNCARQMAGVTRIDLTVAEAAVAAIRLYESAAFATADTRGGKRRMVYALTDPGRHGR